MPQNCVGVCSECEHGILVLEPHFHTGGPAPKWRIACNNMKSVGLLYWEVVVAGDFVFLVSYFCIAATLFSDAKKW